LREEENELLTRSVAKLTLQVALLQRAMEIDRNPPHSADEVAMSLETFADVAPVALVCETFGISQSSVLPCARGVGPAPANVVRMPTKPRFASAGDVLVAIRKVFEEEPAYSICNV